MKTVKKPAVKAKAAKSGKPVARKPAAKRPTSVPARPKTVRQAKTPAEVRNALAAFLKKWGLTQRELARGAGLSKSAASRLCTHGEWPVRDAAAAQMRVQTFLFLRAAQVTQKKLAPEVSTTPEAVPVQAVPTTHPKEDPMLLQHQALTEQAKKHFKLFRSPFLDDVNTRADVFTSGPMNYVRHALLDCAQNHGFMAVVGESGSGKTTLREELEERIREDNKPIIIIKPFVVGMEVNDAKGKTMKCAQIADAIARTLSPGLTLKSNPDAKFEQVKQLLMSSVASGYNHLVLIEEAHRLPQATLRHLKGFMELKDRMRRLLGVCLIGQPELDQVLVPNERTIREIVQRCERVTLDPLDAELPAYLAHKFSRVGADLKAVMEPSAFDAIRVRLQWTPRGGGPKDTVSQCYPLAVNNLMTRAMNACGRTGYDKVDADVIAGC